MLRTIKRKGKDNLIFFSRWLKNPRKVGSVIPSGAALARCITSQIDPKKDGRVLELGAGTGALTEALLKRGISPKRLLVVERDKKLHSFLHQKFPGVTLIHGDAKAVKSLLAAQGIDQVEAIVSSLPLLSFDMQDIMAVMREGLSVLKEDGVFLQYTYGLRSPVPVTLQKRLGIQGHAVGHVWRNIPPATIWLYRKKK